MDLEKKWISIENSGLIELILKSVGDEDKKNLINAVIGEPKIISDILEISKVPKTSGYRKAKELIRDGLLIPREYVTAHDGKRIAKYQAVFETILIADRKK